MTIHPVRTISRKPRQRDPQRLHARHAGRTPDRSVKVQSDPYSDMGSEAEMTSPRFTLRAAEVSRSNNMPKVAKFLVG